ncbi:hypothetical protein [Paenibacillus ferrarius]|uniref:hypothetical protein n=1 Tax=Paenibacillus ferrarius TaxID=1469647 RepID=UPI00117C2174|nr:hypothetical protein [Paenibacillus ferrarius]
MAKLVVQHQPKTFSELTQILNSGGISRNEEDLRFPPCGFLKNALIIDNFFNVFIMDIRLDLIGTYFGFCFDIFTFFWFKCTVSQSNIAFLICLP